jgi:hypothetical protein
VFSPGRLVALDRRTGRRRWALPLHYYGDSNVVYDPDTNLLYGGTAQELLAVNPKSGQVRWTFCPYGQKGESIYSSPTVASGRLFVGDRRGYFHCLDAETGESIWQIHTSRARNNDVNSDPVVVGRAVVVTTNSALALGYDTATGRELWRHRLDGPCTSCRPGTGRTALMWTWRSAYLFSVRDGRLLQRWAFRTRDIRHACFAGGRVFLVTNRHHGPQREPWPVSELRAFRGGAEINCQTYPRHAGAALRYEPSTVRVYEATSHGLGILNPVTGAREVVVRFGTEAWSDCQVDQIHPPAVKEGVLYVINGSGRVFALRHP